MKIITSDLLRQIQSERTKFKSNIEMAEKLGISDSMLSRILKGKVSHISDSHWKKMEGVIQTGCLYGFAKCPLNGSCELKELLETILKIDDPETYQKIDTMIKNTFFNKEKEL